MQFWKILTGLPLQTLAVPSEAGHCAFTSNLGGEWIINNTYLGSLCISCNDQKFLKVLHILVNFLCDESHTLTPGLVGWCRGKKTVWSQVELVSYFDSIMRSEASFFISRSVFFLRLEERALVLLSNNNWSRNCSCHCFCYCYLTRFSRS